MKHIEGILILVSVPLTKALAKTWSWSTGTPQWLLMNGINAEDKFNFLVMSMIVWTIKHHGYAVNCSYSCDW